MSISEMFLMVIGLAVLAIAIFLVPVLIQIRRIGERAEILLDSLNRDIPPLLKNLNDSASELRTLSTALNRRVEEVEQILSLAKNASDNFLHSTSLFKTLLPVITKIGGFGAGLFTFISYLKRSRHNNKTED